MKKFIIASLIFCNMLPSFAGLYGDILPNTPKPTDKQAAQPIKQIADTKAKSPQLTEVEIQMLGQEIIIQKLEEIENDLQKIKERLEIY